MPPKLFDKPNSLSTRVAGPKDEPKISDRIFPSVIEGFPMLELLCSAGSSDHEKACVSRLLQIGLQPESEL